MKKKKNKLSDHKGGVFFKMYCKVGLMSLLLCICIGVRQASASEPSYSLFSENLSIGEGESGSNNFNSMQQNLMVRGKVTDSSGAPLPGVTIVVKGTSQGTITDNEGNYSLPNVPSDATLVFSFVGMITQEILVEGQSVINVKMEEEIIRLEEVVAVGYSTRRAGEITSSISKIDATTIEKMPIIDASEALRTASGVTVRTNHTPGGGASILIRGLGTINDNNPLWVVDGVPGGNVNPNDIESISILKDAASAAIYGARAAGGVILVTTKTGRRNQKPQVRVDIKSGISQNSNYYDMLNTREYGELLWLEAKNSGVTDFSHPLYGSGPEPDIPDYIFPPRAKEGDPSVDPSLYDDKMIHEDGDDTYLIMRANKEGTDWLREADRNAFFLEANLGLTGGSEKTVYSFQAGYLNEEGILKWTGFDRYNLRSNVTSNPTDWLEIGERVGITYSESYGNQGNHAEDAVVSWCYRMPPIVPVYDIMGNYAGTRAPGTGNAQNPIFLLDKNQWDKRKRMNVSGNAYAQINLLEGLSARTTFGFYHNSYFYRDINYVEKAFSERGKYDYLGEGSNYTLQWNWTNTLEYSNTFANLHRVTAMVGTEAIDNNYRYTDASRSEFFSQDPNYIQLATGLQSINNGGNTSSWSLFSVFGRLNYSYANKYFFEGVVRRDGSSRFSEGNRYAVFPAFSLGWEITEENFMDSTSDWLNQFKLRFGYGETGNDRIGNYNSYTNYNIDYFHSFYPITGDNVTTGTTGFYMSALGNPNVKWETTKTTNFGIDAVINRKLNFSIDIWNRKTTDMLYPKQIPLIAGRVSAPSINIGEMNNNGIDFELGYNDRIFNNELQYNFNLNLSHYKNEIVKLSDVAGEFLTGDDHREMVYTRAEKGTSFPEFYGYVVEGIFQTEEEAAAHPKAFGPNGTYNKPGHYKYKDVDGNGVIDSNDRTYIGSPHPDLTGGLNIDLSYKGISLTTYLYFSYGNKMINYVRRWIDFKQFQGGRSKDRLYNSWGSPYLEDNTKAKLPMAEMSDTESQQPSSAFVEDASFLRMEYLRLGYDLNRLFHTNLRGINIFGQVSNVFTISGYSGLDPEVNRGGRNMGIDAGAWPTPRRLTVGFTFDI